MIFRQWEGGADKKDCTSVLNFLKVFFTPHLPPECGSVPLTVNVILLIPCAV